MSNEVQVKSSHLINNGIIGVITERLLLITCSSHVLTTFKKYGGF